MIIVVMGLVIVRERIIVGAVSALIVMVMSCVIVMMVMMRVGGVVTIRNHARIRAMGDTFVHMRRVVRDHVHRPAYAGEDQERTQKPRVFRDSSHGETISISG